MVRGSETNTQPQLVQISRRTSITVSLQTCNQLCLDSNIFLHNHHTPSSLPSQLCLGSWALSLSASKTQSKSFSCKSLETELGIHKMTTFYVPSLHYMGVSYFSNHLCKHKVFIYAVCYEDYMKKEIFRVVRKHSRWFYHHHPLLPYQS